MSSPAMFSPSKPGFMIDLRVDDVAILIESACSSEADIVGDTEDCEYGIFGWFIALEGIKIELWQESLANESAKPKG